MHIPPSTPIFYPNHLRILSVVGDRIRVQFCFYWDTTDLRVDTTIQDLLKLEGDFYGKIRARFNTIPDHEFISDFLMSHEEDLDWFLADDASVLIGRQIQDSLRNALDQIV